MLISAAGDLVTFSKLKVHYKTDYALQTNLFTKETRPGPIKTLYENARDRTEAEVGVTVVSVHLYIVLPSWLASYPTDLVLCEGISPDELNLTSINPS